MDVCFTGTREGMTLGQMGAVRELLDQARPDRVHHGCAEGADREFHAMTVAGTRDLYPCNVEQYEWARANCAAGDVIHPIEAPLVRNRQMVDKSTLIIAAPRTRVEEQRSGTWATVRYARRVKRDRLHVVLAVIGPDHHSRTYLDLSKAKRAVATAASEAK